ncbi:hypothetical protein BDQ12DRAFT_738639 [Crucibulum laeve]|uniref:Glycan binding protein Y3-like domain-containing protein n=1 Tax=Crucibulum laeve TaxID=68775 RepID=A0A5C3LN04_9AGAR|nr:hypothetical protein BDQ12DRAFT_738639 [Crucibulum laeve]
MMFNNNMILTTIVLAFSMTSTDAAPSAAAPVVRRTCFTAGTVGTECGQFIQDFCNSLTSIAFRNNEAKCYDTPNFKCDFGAFLEFTNGLTPPVGTPAAATCIDTLNNVTNTCGGFGGFGNVSGGPTTFTLDPNQGQCKQLEAPGT